jgi:NADH:ubiquinone oxidoreductase subunit
MGILNTLKRAVTWWDTGTFGTTLFTAWRGVRVGTDAQGNVFYRSKDGKRRWVIYNGETEASRVTPDWHGWLHFTWDVPPTEAPPLHRPWQKPHVPNLTGTAAAYAPPGSIRRREPVARSDYEAWRPD